MGRPEGNVWGYLRDTFRLGGWKVGKLTWGGGAYDGLLISPYGFHLYVETKKPGKNVLDPAQVEWGIDMCNRVCAGHREQHVAFEGPVNSREQVNALYARYCDH